jgi:hypothetical protein
MGDLAAFSELMTEDSILSMPAAGQMNLDVGCSSLADRSHLGHHRRDGNVQPGTARCLSPPYRCDHRLS